MPFASQIVAMPPPEFVLKPTPGTEEERLLHLKQVLLPAGSKSVGRSPETGIRNASVSRKHFEVVVEEEECKIRSVAKQNLSVLEIDGSPVGHEWMDFPIGARLELRTATQVSFKYVLEEFDLDTHGSSTPPSRETSNGASNGHRRPPVTERVSEDADDEEENMLHGMQCSFCMGIFVDPTEVDCKGRHLFCLECIKQILKSRNDCPQCRMNISKQCKESILGSKSIYTTRHRVQPAGPETYQSQAIMFLKEMIKRAIEKRLCDYNDETEWRRRSGLEPLPPPSGTDNSDPKPEEQTGTGTTKQNSAVNGGIVKEKSAGPGSSSGGGGDERPRKKAKLNHFAPATSSADDDVAANVIDLVEDSDCD